MQQPWVHGVQPRENDRSSTGFLPPEEFEVVADAFFAQPGVSVRGWETAQPSGRCCGAR